ncbi:hypothetical protein M0R72_09080 [Candidatus Pacearchaeota archaeon]|jgi:hypothetical protein|nr:hypothetical protein [Candidatus Pacearchaeota archaeon]
MMKDTVKETLTVLGFTPSSPQEMQKDMAFLRSARTVFGSVVTRVIVALACAAALAVVGLGIQAALCG